MCGITSRAGLTPAQWTKCDRELPTTPDDANLYRPKFFLVSDRSAGNIPTTAADRVVAEAGTQEELACSEDITLSHIPRYRGLAANIIGELRDGA